MTELGASFYLYRYDNSAIFKKRQDPKLVHFSHSHHKEDPPQIPPTRIAHSTAETGENRAIVLFKSDTRLYLMIPRNFEHESLQQFKCRFVCFDSSSSYQPRRKIILNNIFVCSLFLIYLKNVLSKDHYMCENLQEFCESAFHWVLLIYPLAYDYGLKCAHCRRPSFKSETTIANGHHQRKNNA